MSRIKIEGKLFEFIKDNGSLLVEESSNFGFRWIKFPFQLLSWVMDSLSMCSELNEFVFQKKVGFVTWRIESGFNQWGWFLELNVGFKGSSFSIFVPGSSSLYPWKLFTDAFFQAADFGKDEVQQVGVLDQVYFAEECLAIHNKEWDCHVHEHANLKSTIDEILEFENLIGSKSSVHGSDTFGSFFCDNLSLDAMKICQDEESVSNGVASTCGLDGVKVSFSTSSDVMVNSCDNGYDVSEFIQEANEIRSLSTQMGGFPCFSSSAELLSYSLDSHTVKSNVKDFSNQVKPSISSRSKSVKRSSLNGSSSWDWLPSNVRKKPISKYSEYVSLGVDKKWVLDRLELDDEATDDDIFKRMYQFQKSGKININKKVIRIMEGISKDNQPWV